jgi:ribonuclease HI
MTKSKQPVTLGDLLNALERSKDLRYLARECGLTVRELRRRLARWRREIQVDAGTEPGGHQDLKEKKPSSELGGKGGSNSWPELPLAAELKTSPLPRKGSRVLTAWTDGASKGNPGPAAIGIVFGQKDGPALCTHFEAIGRATNNVAEYRGVIRALEFCRDWRVRRLILHLDSELIARQLTGVYRVKSQDLRPLYQQVLFLARDLQMFRVVHVPRQQNGHADALANQALSAQGRR